MFTPLHTTHAQSQSPLFRLPTEIRLQIYTYTLLSREPIYLPLQSHWRTILPYTTPPLPPLGTGLAAICRLIHSELDIRPLYRDNTFVFRTPYECSAFFARLPNRFKDCITSITIDLQCCIDRDGECDALMELAWFEYLACPSTHYRSNDNRHCTASACSHLFFDLPHIQDITLDARAAIKAALSRGEVNRILAFLLRGSCNGDTEVSTARTCRPDLTVTLVLSGAQTTPNCGTCKSVPQGEPWDPVWLCAGEKAEECRTKYGDVGKGEALPVVAPDGERWRRWRSIYWPGLPSV